MYERVNVRLLLRLCARAYVRVCLYRLECGESGSQTPQQGIRHQQLPKPPAPLPSFMLPWSLGCPRCSILQPRQWRRKAPCACPHRHTLERFQVNRAVVCRQTDTTPGSISCRHSPPAAHRKVELPKQRQWWDGATHCNYPARQQQTRRPSQNTRGGGDGF